MNQFAPMPLELETERLRLRAWEIADAGVVRALWAERDPRSLRIIGSDGRPTVDEMRTRIVAQREESDRSGLSLLAIEPKDRPAFIGYCGLVVGNSTDDEPEIAFELLRSAHGSGYATEAARAVIAAAAETGRCRLWATVRVWNAPSFRVLTKLGFVDSGGVIRDPQRGDLVWMTLELGAPSAVFDQPA